MTASSTILGAGTREREDQGEPFGADHSSETKPASSLGASRECSSRGPEAITEDEIVKLIARTWLTAKGTDDETADELSDDLALVSPEDHAACVEIAQTLLHRLSAFAAAIPSGEWRPIDAQCFDALDDEGQQLVLNAMQERACEVSNTTYFDDYQQAEMFKAGLVELALQLALAGEARKGQDAQRLDPKDDHAADLSATPQVSPLRLLADQENSEGRDA